MVEQSTVARPGDARVSTGNASLDRMLEGGLVSRRPYLIVGPSGVGKTTLAIQFLCEGVRRGERVLLVTLEEPPNEARVNHRGLEPELGRVEVFDAIPDIMRYERTPFKDIASVRHASPFEQVPFAIRHSPELASVEVTITALEQMLRTEVTRKNYSRLVIDSLTALQYFCMKGFEPVAGAQSFLRFLSELRVTTLLTVEAPLEDVETPERMLARGEIRLFRWELEGQTVRAVGVEKFRGSSHDIRLHPYRIGPKGIDINLEVTISRDTRQIIEPIVPRPVAPAAEVPVAPFVSAVTPLMDEVRDLIALGADVAPARTEIEAALSAATAGQLDQAQAHLSRMSSLVVELVDKLSQRADEPLPVDPGAAAALQRARARADTMRTGIPPTSLPAAAVLQVQLGALLSLLPAPVAVPAEPPPEPGAIAPPTIEAVSAPTPEELRPVPEAPEISLPPVESAPVPPVSLAVQPPVEEPAGTVAVPAEVVGVAEPNPPSELTTAPISVPAVPADHAGPAEPAAIPKIVETPQPEAVAPAEATVPPPRKEPPPAAKPVKYLPPPPKPRPSVAGPRATKAAPPPQPKHAARIEEPPPLPTTTMPGWLSPPAPAPAPKTSSPAPAVHPTEPPATLPSPPRESTPAPKKRRKPVGGAGGRKAAPSARAAVSAAPSSPSAPSHPHAVAPTPEGASGASPPSAHGSEPTAKPKRRAPRKRKAPPVVAAQVEPVPPGALGDLEPAPNSQEPSTPPAPPEG